MGIAITGRDVHGAAVGGRGMTISDLALIDALDPETRAVVERYATGGGVSRRESDLEDIKGLIQDAESQLREASYNLRQLAEGK